MTAVVALLALMGLGALGAVAGGAPWHRAGARVLFWSSLAMAVTYAIGTVVGANV
jgi:VIT1/CCC1 family predicted Fe2+/Mn2+ transporter